MFKIKEVSSFDGTSWGTAVPLGANDVNIDITTNTQNPADQSSTLDSLNATDVTVADGDTGAGAWTKYNTFRKRVVNNLNLRKKTESLSNDAYEALEQAEQIDPDTIYLINDDFDYDEIYSKSEVDNLLAAALAQEILYITIPSITALPYTVTNSAISSQHVVLEATFGTPNVRTRAWTVVTSNGSLTINGTGDDHDVGLIGETSMTLKLGCTGTYFSG